MEDVIYQQLLESAVEQSFNAILITTAQLDSPGPTIVYVNHAMTQMTGYTKEELIGKTPRLLQGEKTDRTMLTCLRQTLEAGKYFEAVTTNYCKDGRAYPVEWNISPVHSATGDITHFVAVQRDLTRAFHDQETIQILSSALELSSDLVIMTDIKGRIEYVNPAFEQHTGHHRDAVMGKTTRILKSGQHTPQFYAHMWDTLTHGRPFSDTFIDRTTDGQILYLEQTITPVKNAQGQIIRYVSVGKDVTERVDREKKLKRIANTDSLTGLPNRMSFDRRLDKEMTRRDRYMRPLSLIMLDIDHFKFINDTYGHHVGDNVLVEFARLLSSNLREMDLCARWGGEEFMVLAPETTRDQALQLADKLRQLIADTPFPSVGHMTASFGVVEIGDETAIETVKRIDRALYEAKRLGRNRVVTG
ncbi:diguanylate cyclase [Vreelandella andesensis]|uniref:Diguanylate cyclase n=1 Tax=Vreelandella andesensis TaxID=447567 RepID=A0A433KKR9_9GAMM|nr:diguanylate cyclase [Halomonas andesensis]RUR30392.1 diguanylate cyclase [Halomonas andesensis]